MDGTSWMSYSGYYHRKAILLWLPNTVFLRRSRLFISVSNANVKHSLSLEGDDDASIKDLQAFVNYHFWNCTNAPPVKETIVHICLANVSEVT